MSNKSCYLRQLWADGEEVGGAALFAVKTSKAGTTNYTQVLIPWVAQARQVSNSYMNHFVVSPTPSNSEGRGNTAMNLK